MINEVSDEDIEAAAAIDWKEFFKDSLMEPFDIKLPERPPEDVELLDGPSVRRKPKQRPRRKYCATLSKEQRKTCQLTHHGTVIKELYHDGSWHYGRGSMRRVWALH